VLYLPNSLGRAWLERASLLSAAVLDGIGSPVPTSVRGNLTAAVSQPAVLPCMLKFGDWSLLLAFASILKMTLPLAVRPLSLLEIKREVILLEGTETLVRSLKKKYWHILHTSRFITYTHRPSCVR